MYRLLFLCFTLGIINYASGFYNHYPHNGHGFYPHNHGYHHHNHEHDDDFDHQDHHHFDDSDEDDHNHSEDCDHGGHNHQHQEKSNSEKIDKLEDVANKYVEADMSFQHFCLNHSQASPLITYGMDACVFKYLLPENGVFDVKVRIIKKVLEVSVKTQAGDLKSNLFEDMRVLPDILNVNQAGWSLSKRDLKITIPYKVPLMTEFSAQCDTSNNDTIVVPSKSIPAFIYRSSVE